MDTASNTPPTRLNKKDAETIARHFNKCFGHATMYGVSHQMFIDGISPFSSALAAVLDNCPLITVTVDHESIVFEEWNVDKIVNAKKLASHFKKANIQSFSFEKGLESADLTAFLDVAANAAKYPTADLMKSELSARRVKGIRLNYIMYRKMTTDEEVINKDVLTGLVPGKKELPPSHDPGDSFSLTKVLSNPKAAAGALFYPKSDGHTLEPEALVSSMARLGDQIRSAGGEIAADNLMEAIMVLREECIDHVSDFKTAGIVKDDMQAVLGEVEKLTHDTIIYLMKEEYKSGEVSTKRLAQILRRMLPDARELRALLPHLKRALLDEGMPFVKYIELVNELRRELAGDDVVGVLAQATREMGVTPDEVMDEIKKHPADAARLIILASELRRNGADSNQGLDQVLTEYIEKVSRDLAVTAATEGPAQDGGRRLGAVLQKIESNFLDTLKKQGVEQSVLTALTARLTERMPYLLDITKTEWLGKTLERNPGLDTGMLAKLVAGTVQQAYDIDTQRDSLFALFSAKGYSPDQISEILQQAATRVSNSAQQIDLPKGVLSSSAIMYFLERECKLSLRYHNPFSLLIVSILRIIDENGTSRPLTPDERPLFMKNLIALLKHVMRDIDMIGVPSSSAECISFVILPMTAESNTYNLVERLRREMGAHIFNNGIISTKLSLAISITGFDEKNMPDKTALLKTSMAHHRAVEKIRNSGIEEKK